MLQDCTDSKVQVSPVSADRERRLLTRRQVVIARREHDELRHLDVARCGDSGLSALPPTLPTGGAFIGRTRTLILPPTCKAVCSLYRHLSLSLSISLNCVFKYKLLSYAALLVLANIQPIADMDTLGKR